MAESIWSDPNKPPVPLFNETRPFKGSLDGLLGKLFGPPNQETGSKKSLDDTQMRNSKNTEDQEAILYWDNLKNGNKIYHTEREIAKYNKLLKKNLGLTDDDLQQALIDWNNAKADKELNG